MRKRVNKRKHLDQEVMITFIFKTGMILDDYESILILVPYLEFLFKDFHFGCQELLIS